MTLFRRTLILTLGLALLAPVGLAQAKTAHSSSATHLTSAVKKISTKKKHHKKKHHKKHKKPVKKTLAAKSSSSVRHA